MFATVEQIRLALHTINSGTCTNSDRRAAEAVLTHFQSQRSSLGLAVQVLQQQYSSHLQELALFCAQTIRHIICKHGYLLDQHERAQLRHLLVGPLTGVTPLALTRQICLSLAALAAVDSSYNIISEIASTQLPHPNAVELLQQLAEEACSDLRHVALPGITGSKQLDWATETRERFRSWSPGVLQLLHNWSEQQKSNSQLLVKLLSCLTAWVKLGALHVVDLSTAHHTAQIGLMCIQSHSEQEVSAALELLQELPEYAPEPLLLALQPHITAMAQAACQAAARTAPANLMHAAAWIKAFVSYVAAIQYQLLQPQDTADSAVLRDALLQVSMLPQLSAAGFVCLPALELWSALLDAVTLPLAACSDHSTVPPGDSSRPVDDVSDGDTPCESCKQPLPLSLICSCLLLLMQVVANWLWWQQDPSCLVALEDKVVTAAVEGVGHTTCRVLGADKYLAAIAHIWGGTTQTQQQQQQQQLQDTVVLELQRCGSEGSQAPGILVSGLLSDQADFSAFPAWQQQRLQKAFDSIAAAPGNLRLCTAVMLAAAADGAGGGDGSERCETVRQPRAVADHSQACNVIIQLLSAAATALQQTADVQPQLAVAFCQAAKVWATELVFHFFSSSAGDDVSDMAALLQLLLALAACPEVTGAAAAAVRVVLTAALNAGWHRLHELAPMVMQAANSLSCTGSCEQDLLASLAACLAAAGVTEQQQHQLRLTAAQELVQPGIAYLDTLLQQLHSGGVWCTLAPTADGQLCRQLARAQTLLEGHLLQQQEHCRHHKQQQDKHYIGPGGNGSCHLDDESYMVVEDEAHSFGNTEGQQQETTICGQAAATAAHDPAFQLLSNQLWPRLHSLITVHNACGRFLHHYGKCCCRMLKIHPCLLMPRLQQFLQVTVLGIARPGGCTLGESWSAVIEVGCRQGSGILLESGPQIMQALAQLWSVPEVSVLTQPGAGDQKPDLAEQILKLHTTLLRQGTVLQQYSSSWASVVDQALAAGVSCAACCHKKVASCGLLLLSSVLFAASSKGPQQEVLLEIVLRRGAQVIYGVLGALLAPSPLPRLQKAAAVLMELAAVASSAESQQHPPNQVHSWFLQAASHFVPATLTQAEGMNIAVACSALLASSAEAGGQKSSDRQPMTRSYITARRLKKVLRDFAETHVRMTNSSAACL